jgi:hypothetical protein
VHRRGASVKGEAGGYLHQPVAQPLGIALVELADREERGVEQMRACARDALQPDLVVLERTQRQVAHPVSLSSRVCSSTRERPDAREQAELSDIQRTDPKLYRA